MSEFEEYIRKLNTLENESKAEGTILLMAATMTMLYELKFDFQMYVKMIDEQETDE